MSGALRLQSLPARETELESPEPASTELRGYSESALFPVGMGMPDLTPSSPNGSLDRLGKRTKDEEGSSLKGPPGFCCQERWQRTQLSNSVYAILPFLKINLGKAATPDRVPQSPQV